MVGLELPNEFLGRNAVPQRAGKELTARVRIPVAASYFFFYPTTFSVPFIPRYWSEPALDQNSKVPLWFAVNSITAGWNAGRSLNML